jgi:Subtilase family
MFDGFEQGGCMHGVIEEQVVKNFAPGVNFQVTEYPVTHGGECDELDIPALKSHLDEAIQIAKTSRVAAYFGYVVYGKLQTFSKQFSALAKVATIVVGTGNIANDSCTQNWLAPYAVLVGAARNGAIESYSGRGACTDLYLDFGGSVTVTINGQYFGASGTSTSSAIVAARALTLWTANPQASSTQVSAALSLKERILTTGDLMAPPGVEVSPLHSAQGSVSVAGRVKGPVSSVSVYRGLPSAGACRGRALATVAVGQDSRFTLTVLARGANLCVEPEPFGQAVGVPIG